MVASSSAPSSVRVDEAAIGARRRVLLAGPLAPVDGGTTTGGVATHVSELARQLHLIDWDVSVYANNLPPGREMQTGWGAVFPPVRIASLDSFRIPHSMRVVLRAFASYRVANEVGQDLSSLLSNALGMRRALERARPDVVHYHHAELRPWYGAIAGAVQSSVITAHSLSSFRDEGAAALQRMAAEHLRAADLVLTVSADSARALGELVPDIEVQVVPNGIDVAAFARHPGNGRRRFGPDPLVLYLGWLAASKGVLDLVESMVAVRQAFPNARLAIVGPEVDLTADTVRSAWTGHPDALEISPPVTQSEVASWLHRADLLVVPSRIREGQPRVILEAMAASVPVVATDVGGVASLLENGRLGRLVAAESPASLAQGIIETLQSPGTTSERTEAARSAVDAYDAPRIAGRVADSYTEAMRIHDQRVGRP